jgi:hypothetical protein
MIFQRSWSFLIPEGIRPVVLSIGRMGFFLLDIKASQ